MIRKIVEINEEKCVGCGLCANTCREGAIGIVDGKAKLLKDDYCDGLGNCLPACPTDAIRIVEREAAAFSKQEMKENQKRVKKEGQYSGISVEEVSGSELRQWPVQIELVPINALYFEDAKLLIAADCTAYAYANFHQEFMRNKVTLIGCPKLDEVDYSEKLTEIIRENNIKSVTAVRMEVPCCGGIEHAVKQALQASGKFIPWQVVTISTEGNLLD